MPTIKKRILRTAKPDGSVKSELVAILAQLEDNYCVTDLDSLSSSQFLAMVAEFKKSILAAINLLHSEPLVDLVENEFARQHRLFDHICDSEGTTEPGAYSKSAIFRNLASVVHGMIAGRNVYYVSGK